MTTSNFSEVGLTTAAVELALYSTAAPCPSHSRSNRRQRAARVVRAAIMHKKKITLNNVNSLMSFTCIMITTLVQDNHNSYNKYFK